MVLESFIGSLRALRWCDVVKMILSLAIAINIGIYVIWLISLLTQCESSVVTVLSESMEPGYTRGDIIVLQHKQDDVLKVGDIVVFNSPGALIPIIHRVHRIHHRLADNHSIILTKGDNNEVDDRWIYRFERHWITEEQILGKSFFYLPRIGHVVLALGERQ